MRRYLTSCIFLLVTVAPVLGTAAGQGRTFSVYAPVPQRLRPSLDSRLKLYVELERAGQFEGLYDLFSEAYVARLKTFNRGSKAEYVAAERGSGKYRMGVADFTPTSTRRVSAGVYIIFGRIKSPLGERLSEYKGSIEARRQRGDWYFSELGVEVED
jgi:hypothetical protein